MHRRPRIWCVFVSDSFQSFRPYTTDSMSLCKKHLVRKNKIRKFGIMELMGFDTNIQSKLMQKFSMVAKMCTNTLSF